MIATPFSSTSHTDFRRGWLLLVSRYKIESFAQAELTMGSLASLTAAHGAFCQTAKREGFSSDTDLPAHYGDVHTEIKRLNPVFPA